MAPKKKQTTVEDNAQTGIPRELRLAIMAAIAEGAPSYDVDARFRKAYDSLIEAADTYGHPIEDLAILAAHRLKREDNSGFNARWLHDRYTVATRYGTDDDADVRAFDIDGYVGQKQDGIAAQMAAQHAQSETKPEDIADKLPREMVEKQGIEASAAPDNRDPGADVSLYDKTAVDTTESTDEADHPSTTGVTQSDLGAQITIPED